MSICGMGYVENKKFAGSCIVLVHFNMWCVSINCENTRIWWCCWMMDGVFQCMQVYFFVGCEILPCSKNSQKTSLFRGSLWYWSYCDQFCFSWCIILWNWLKKVMNWPISVGNPMGLILHMVNISSKPAIDSKMICLTMPKTNVTKLVLEMTLIIVIQNV